MRVAWVSGWHRVGWLVQQGFRSVGFALLGTQFWTPSVCCIELQASFLVEPFVTDKGSHPYASAAISGN
jgi:hypothetical protein